MDNSHSFAKKLSRLSEPSMRLYFIFLIIFTVAALVLGQYILAAGEAVIIILLSLYSRITAKKYRKELSEYIESISLRADTLTSDSLSNLPIPAVMFQAENYKLLWTNDSFLGITGNRENIFEYKLTEIAPGFSAKWLLEGKSICPETVKLGDRKYTLYGTLERTERKTGGYSFIGTVYWFDITNLAEIEEDYVKSRPLLAVIMLDNYEEFRGGLTDSANAASIAAIDEKISAWAGGHGGYFSKFERDRYVFIFEERHMKSFVEDKFRILDEIREMSVPSGIPPTVSIGIGRGARTLEESLSFAKLALEMALSRGGDQVVIKNKSGFDFYGGRSKEIEKRTKVKSRVVANALGELIKGSSVVLVMGHKYADFDSIGAAVGICCIARKFGKTAKIAIDMTHNSAHQLIRRIMALPEYKGVFISSQDALNFVNDSALLVVVDTNRPDQVESEQILNLCEHIVQIDHHRRAANYIDEVELNLHEPYASSSCELVTELMQYLLNQSDILRPEAEALLAGIVMDTKNFSARTGSRTFDAASYLRRIGSDTTEVKKLLQNDFASTISKYRIIESAKMYGNGIAIAVPGTIEDKVIAAQAADEMLSISGVHTSFVIFHENDMVKISARSMGDINVQVVLEKLGGGGNISTAAAQIKDKSYEEVLTVLLSAIDDYLKNQHKKEYSKEG